MDAYKKVWSWQGVRRDESLARRYVPEFEEVGGGLCNYRPIARWNVESVLRPTDIWGLSLTVVQDGHEPGGVYAVR